ncbi:hypothetical protein [Paraflavitalea speifideaquila]|uniref:anti-sigma factor family protein n=1 Tax=Paraflavitalea speifideaquila TaxID=3076558 RepID=UPI0028EDC202|nr:hypothetical protein [Paraflavitalea speifideiaquila]
MKYTLEDIARYADGLMEAEEQQAFEAALPADKELQEQLALYREVDISLQEHFASEAEREQLKAALQTMRPVYFGTKSNTATSEEAMVAPVQTAPVAPTGKVVSMKRYLGAAMAVAALLVVTLLVWNPLPAIYTKNMQIRK